MGQIRKELKQRKVVEQNANWPQVYETYSTSLPLNKSEIKYLKESINRIEEGYLHCTNH